MAVVDGIAVNRFSQIQFTDDVSNREIEILQYDFLQLFIRVV